MKGYVPGEQPRGGKFIKLNTNENPTRARPSVQRAIGTTIKMGLQKYPDPMATAFRARAGEVLGVPPDWIMCGNGSDDILTIVTRAFVGQGDLLRLPYPSYILYKTLAELQGAECRGGSFQPDWRLATTLRQHGRGLKLAFLPNPNSPSGTIVPPERVLRASRSRCRARCWSTKRTSISRIEIACTWCANPTRSWFRERLSKSYALAGLRFGFIVAQPHIIERAGEGEGQLQLRCPVDRRRDCGDRRSGMARRESGEDSCNSRTADRAAARAGISGRRLASQLCVGDTLEPQTPRVCTSNSSKRRCSCDI